MSEYEVGDTVYYLDEKSISCGVVDSINMGSESVSSYGVDSGCHWSLFDEHDLYSSYHAAAEHQIKCLLLEMEDIFCDTIGRIVDKEIPRGKALLIQPLFIKWVADMHFTIKQHR